MRKPSIAALFMLFQACSAPPKPTTPSLTPETAGELLRMDNKAQTWLVYVKKQDPRCAYQLTIPDQSTHPQELDLEHIVSCGGGPSPRALDASVIFVFDTDAQHWKVQRFSD